MYRTIDASFWTDPKVRALSIDARLVFLYLITNPHGHVGGIYSFRIGYLTLDCGLSDTLSEIALDTLSSVEMIRLDRENEVVWVKNMFRYQASGEKNERSVANQLATLHGSPLVDDFLRYYPSVQKFMNEPPKPKRGKISNRSRFNVLQRCEFKCVYCGVDSRASALEVDYAIPLAQGGVDDESNMVASCWACNNGKGDRVSEFGTPNRNRTGTEYRNPPTPLLDPKPAKESVSGSGKKTGEPGEPDQPSPEADARWKELKIELEGSMNKHTFTSFGAPLQLLSIEPWKFRVPNQHFVAWWTEPKHQELLRAVINVGAEEPITILAQNSGKG